jgi:spermidine/putrescine transport system substrate-binding protein
MDIERAYRALLERYLNGDVDRRTFLGLMGRAALAAGVTGSAMVPFARFALAAQSIHFEGFGGVAQEALSKNVMKPFAAASGITVNEGSFTTEDELMAKVKAGHPGEYNFFMAASEFACLRFLRLGQGMELDEGKIPRLKDLMPRGVDAYRKLWNGKLSAVPYALSGIWVGYNSEKIDRAEVEAKGTKILVDPKYKGATTGEDRWLSRIWYAALQTGQDPNNIQNMDAIWDNVRQSRKNVVKYYASGAEQMALFASREVILGDAWFVRIYNLKKQGIPVEGWPPQGIYVTFSSLMALKDCPLDPFYQIVDILLRPEVLITVAIELGNAPLLDPTIHPMPKEVQAIPGFDPTGKLEGYRTIDPVYWTDNADAWQRQYKRVMTEG